MHHPSGMCGEVVQEPLQQEPIERLLGWRGGLLTSPGGRVLAGEVRQQKGEVSQCPLRYWRVQGITLTLAPGRGGVCGSPGGSSGRDDRHENCDVEGIRHDCHVEK